MKWPRYPIYVPSKGRVDVALTCQLLERHDVPYRLVVEADEADTYADAYPKAQLLVLPFSDRGLLAARNWILDHSTDEGHDRHWQLDDNIRRFHRLHRSRRLDCHPATALRVCEDFTDRYSNVAVSGLQYRTFAHDGKRYPPFMLNQHVYSCSLINNQTGIRWRLVYNDDTDLCLQALSSGWCTILLNAFLADKIATMKLKGGNTDDLYQGDGRLIMSRSLERRWPKVVTTKRRWDRPQHVVAHQWKRFDTQLQLKDEYVGTTFNPDEYGLQLKAVGDVRSERLRKLLD